MRKGLLKIMSVVVLLTVVLCFTACASAGAADNTAETDNNVTDTVITDIEAENEDYEYDIIYDNTDNTTVSSETIYNDERFENTEENSDKPVWPVFGLISRGFTGQYPENHDGIDIAAAPDEKIYAADDGIVVRAEYTSTGDGVYCIIEHDGYSSVYAHCSDLVVKAEQNVKKGDLIAYVGSTGNSTGPHLHFEIIKDGKSVDPYTIYE